MIASDLDKLLNGFTEQSKEILKDDLVGIYLHGSAVMGCFNHEQSDIDLIIAVERPLSDAVKRAYMDMVTAYSAMGPKKGIEMSVVLRAACKPFVYPTPFELHYSEGHATWYKSDPDDYIRRMNGTDKDLAAHFTIINRRGKCLYGAPIPEVFAEIPTDDYMDSLWFDVEGAAEEIVKYPTYLTLNLTRVLAFKEEGLVLSKKEGGEWAIERLPAEFRPLIMNALRAYTESAEVIYDNDLAVRYAEYMIGRIRR